MTLICQASLPQDYLMADADVDGPYPYLAFFFRYMRH